MKGFFLAIILLFLIFDIGFAQPNIKIDSATLNSQILDTYIVPNKYQVLLDSNLFLKNLLPPISYTSISKNPLKDYNFFYIFIAILLTIGITRTLYPRYFTTLFKVFFNSSLKQSQLTDQLNQAVVPALLFNLIFFTTGGMLIAFLIKIFYPLQSFSTPYLVGFCILILGITYLTKYIALRFTGWVSLHNAEANAYIFIIFLINKVIGVFLAPVIIILYFSSSNIVNFTIISSLIVVILLYFMRFFRSYGILKGKIKITLFHFLLYITCLEILPIALLYKAILMYLG